MAAMAVEVSTGYGTGSPNDKTLVGGRKAEGCG